MEKGPTDTSTTGDTSIGEKTETDGMPCFRDKLEKRGFSKETIQIISRSWAPATQKQYQSYIKKWWDFCTEHKINGYETNVKYLLEFFTTLFKQKLSFSAINTAKSALLTCVTVNNSYSWGQDVNIIRFLKGVHNFRPPIPKYTTTWDVDTVLNHLDTQAPLNVISLKELTLKTAMLVALTSGSRAQSIHLMNLDLMKESQNLFTFYFDSPLKTSRISSKSQIIEVRKMEGNTCCVYSAVAEYIKRTKELRKTGHLWISWTKPYLAVSRDSISRWLKLVLKASGIDTNVFGGHSTRMASTSKAKTQGVGLSSIITTAGWNTTTNFYKYYLRNVEPENHRQAFAEAVLSKKHT